MLTCRSNLALALPTRSVAKPLGPDAAGVILSGQHGHLQVVASTSNHAQDLELFELQSDAGPCLDCLHTGHVVADVHRLKPQPGGQQTALNIRVLLEQAKGVLLARAGVDLDEAQLTRSYSGRSNEPLRDVAAAVIDGSLALRELKIKWPTCRTRDFDGGLGKRVVHFGLSRHHVAPAPEVTCWLPFATARADRLAAAYAPAMATLLA